MRFGTMAAGLAGKAKSWLCNVLSLSQLWVEKIHRQLPPDQPPHSSTLNCSHELLHEGRQVHCSGHSVALPLSHLLDALPHPVYRSRHHHPHFKKCTRAIKCSMKLTRNWQRSHRIKKWRHIRHFLTSLRLKPPASNTNFVWLAISFAHLASITAIPVVFACKDLTTIVLGLVLASAKEITGIPSTSYRNFYLLLLFLSIEAIDMLWMCSAILGEGNELMIKFKERPTALFIFIYVALFAWFIIGMFIFHSFLSLINTTTYEVVKNIWKKDPGNPFQKYIRLYVDPAATKTWSISAGNFRTAK